jgi:hypothetical protein
MLTFSKAVELMFDVDVLLNKAYNQPCLRPSWAKLHKAVKHRLAEDFIFYRTNPCKSVYELHQLWCDIKRSQGWSYGSFNAKHKKTPWLVDFNKLSTFRQIQLAVLSSFVFSLRVDMLSGNLVEYIEQLEK